MANRTDRPDLDDHGCTDGIDGVGQDGGPAGDGTSASRYKQVRRRAGSAPDDAATSGVVAETNRMKRTRRGSTTSGSTASTASGAAGSTASGKVAGGRTPSGKAPSGKAAGGKAVAGRGATGKATSSRSATSRAASGKSPSVASVTGDAGVAESEAVPKATADTPARKSDVSAKWAVDRLDGRERRISFAAAGAAVLFGVTIYISETHDKNFHLAKNQLAPEWTLILGIAAGALLLGATFLGRRAPVGFVALFAGAMFTGSSIVFGLPFIAVALWILYRSYKVQKEMSASVRAARAESRAQNPRATSASARGAAAQNRGAKGAAKGATKAKGPAMPEGNKRFTPKRPPPPAPKPSRRERKTAQPSD
jgi:hypothetical protein